MPYDSTLPADHAPVVAAELRSQFTGLNDLITVVSGECDDLYDRTSAKPDFSDMNNAIAVGTAGACPDVAKLNLTVSNPPTQAQVQAIADKLDELLALLKRE